MESQMRLNYGVIDILWGALRAIDASKDPRSESGPVLRVKREMLRTIVELDTGEPERIDSRRTTVAEPDNVA